MRLLSILFCVLLLAACATASHVITGKTRAPIDPSAVRIYSTAPPQYEEIAAIDATSRLSGAFGEQNKMDAVIERLKREAASLGANGVLLQATGSEYGGCLGPCVTTGIGPGRLSLGTGPLPARAPRTRPALA